jgi:hypothetical protein
VGAWRDRAGSSSIAHGWSALAGELCVRRLQTGTRIQLLRTSALIVLLLVGGTGCNRTTARRAVTPVCPAAWHAEWSGDSAIALCVPAGFARAASSKNLWERGDIDSPDRAWLRVSVDTLRTPDDHWPPHLASPASCVADCTTADSVVEHADPLGGDTVRTETGLVSGVSPGLRRQPLLGGGGSFAWGGGVGVTGTATRGVTLDTLRAALRTVQLGSP